MCQNIIDKDKLFHYPHLPFIIIISHTFLRSWCGFHGQLKSQLWEGREELHNLFMTVTCSTSLKFLILSSPSKKTQKHSIVMLPANNAITIKLEMLSIANTNQSTVFVAQRSQHGVLLEWWRAPAASIVWNSPGSALEPWYQQPCLPLGSTVSSEIHNTVYYDFSLTLCSRHIIQWFPQMHLAVKMKEFRSVLYHKYWCWLEYLPNITITQPLLIKLWLIERGKISAVAA